MRRHLSGGLQKSGRFAGLQQGILLHRLQVPGCIRAQPQPDFQRATIRHLGERLWPAQHQLDRVPADPRCHGRQHRVVHATLGPEAAANQRRNDAHCGVILLTGHHLRDDAQDLIPAAQIEGLRNGDRIAIHELRGREDGDAVDLAVLRMPVRQRCPGLHCVVVSGAQGVGAVHPR